MHIFSHVIFTIKHPYSILIYPETRGAYDGFMYLLKNTIFLCGVRYMKMPDRIPQAMFAPCGMNCMVCCRHCLPKKSCGGCLMDADRKTEGSKNCRILACLRQKGLHYCFSCENFPCSLLYKMDKRYRDRYAESLIENSILARDQGLDAFLAAERKNGPVKNVTGSSRCMTMNAANAILFLEKTGPSSKKQKGLSQSVCKKSDGFLV